MKAPFSMCTFHTSCFIRQDGHGLYFYLRTSRLDLDDYNKEVEEGCHINGTWMSIVGFEGACDILLLIPKQWKTGIPLKSILETNYNGFDYPFRNYFSVD
jgi:trehalose/maltose hydrolase-like predicted phosphorylase